MRISKIVFILCCFTFQHMAAQTSIKILTEKKGVSIRGLSVPTDKVIWASGSKGSIAKSINGGESFEWLTVKGYEARDFRTIHAWNEREAVIAAVAAPAVILRTEDGGYNWRLVTEIIDSNMFLDAIHFTNDSIGWIVGDPIEKNIFLMQTKDKGNTWQEIGAGYFASEVKEGEAFFASSGTNIAHTKDALMLVSGGMASRLWVNGYPSDLPLLQGGKSTGANSIAISPDEKKIIIVGGDFAKDTLRKNNMLCLLQKQVKTNDAKQWQQAVKYQGPNGYRSCVEFVNNELVLACGTSGVDLSKNGGQNWNLISNQSFHVVQHQPGKKAVFFAGSGGRIGYLTLD